VTTIIETKLTVSAVEAIREVGKMIVDYRNDSGWSWVHMAAGSGQLELLKYFLDCGIDPNWTDAMGWTALDIARHHKWEIAEKCLRERGGMAGREIGGNSCFRANRYLKLCS
jgi:ankyrin repeat protein